MNTDSLAVDYAALDDNALATRVQGGDREAFRHIMKRCNQRLFRAARAVVGSDNEAEDVVQGAYVDAYAKIGGFRGECALLTWLTRIVLNEAYGRLRLRQRHANVDVDVDQIDAAQLEHGNVIAFPTTSTNSDPAAALARDQVRRLLEQAIVALPEPFRVVYILREIEECSVEDTATALGLRPETVKTRLFRARRQLREALHDKLANCLVDAFPFLGPRCDRITDAVMQKIGSESLFRLEYGRSVPEPE
jgi:RNA polymerase sigma-70 factor (ECF subfamily)